MTSDLNILIFETNPSDAGILEERFNSLGYSLTPTISPDIPIHQIEAMGPDLAVLGSSLNMDQSLKCIHKLKIADPYIPILTSCNDECLLGKDASPPFEGIHYLTTNMTLEEISEVIKSALAHKTQCKLHSDYTVFIGQNRAIQDIRRRIKIVSDKDITVLVTGESGTGKELIARSIHYHSNRCGLPLVKINCGALPDELLESEIFGFQKGAFTGAHQEKPGLLELADKGTLFIDEIGALSLFLQVKFLQVTEDQEFSKLGGTEEKLINTRIVAATNSNLLEKVNAGTFRKDLYYRLNVVHIESPPLRERTDDIPLLIHFFMNKYCFSLKRELVEVPAEVEEYFLNYHWPGNVRELENVIRRAIVIKDWDFVFEDLNLDSDVPDNHEPGLREKSPPLSDRHVKIEKYLEGNDVSLKKISKSYTNEVEHRAISKALRITNWNRKKAAGLLQVSYKTLLNRIQELDLKPEEG
ncbi:sigma-54 interaction domain-containing protein [Thermodesulfobacteriota bacterium]